MLVFLFICIAIGIDTIIGNSIFLLFHHNRHYLQCIQLCSIHIYILRCCRCSDDEEEGEEKNEYNSNQSTTIVITTIVITIMY